MSTLVIPCASCQQKLSVSASDVGRMAECPVCGSKTRIVLNAVADKPPVLSDSQVSDSTSSDDAVQLDASPVADSPFESGAPQRSAATEERHPDEPSASRPEGVQPLADGETEDEVIAAVEVPIEYEPTAEELEPVWLIQTADQQQFGPLALNDLDEWIAEGRVTPTALIRHHDESEWRLITTTYPILGTTQSYLLPSAKASIPMLPHRGGLLLTLAIIGLVSLVPLISILVMIMSSNDIMEMNNNRLDPAGERQTKGAFYVGTIGLVVQVIAAAVAVYVLAWSRGVIF